MSWLLGPHPPTLQLGVFPVSPQGSELRQFCWDFREGKFEAENNDHSQVPADGEGV